MGWRKRQEDEDVAKLREERVDAALCIVCGGEIVDPRDPDETCCSWCRNNAEKPD